MSTRLLAATLLALVPVAASAAPICHATGHGWQQLDLPTPAVSAHLRHGDHAPTSWFLDADGDGLGDPNDAILSCGDLPGYVANGDDLDDDDATVGACMSVTGGWSTTFVDGEGSHEMGVSTFEGTSCAFSGGGLVGTGYGRAFTVVASMPDGAMTCYGTVVSGSRLDMSCPIGDWVLTR